MIYHQVSQYFSHYSSPFEKIARDLRQSKVSLGFLVVPQVFPQVISQVVPQVASGFMGPNRQWSQVSLGFLVVGLSAYFGEPIVDWNPLTSEYLGADLGIPGPCGAGDKRGLTMRLLCG